MAEIVKNPKDFKVIKITMNEVNNAFGGLGICDACNCSAFHGYYIAVLNSWYCEEDYEKFMKSATNYPEDHKYESKNFDNAKKLLKI
ncbi:hypothetical protein OZ664_05465 [Elizabethkingia sp. HX WHF]|uniref:demethylase n=1 Tax=Elizabethkingia TaxID=308865 RepID=UPI0018C22FDD|nr:MULTISPECIES: demethylase [Elizabethkingia]MDV3943647.1 demethylase [Elizabethkingia anophelis]MBG0512897.1 demethylase [Elizabethkingia meningoseptica]MBG0515164.1 demethylase [Elizabethkingia meningoseptica]MDX8563443.1 hypothetical protein [Elizabethkingia sp. HX WHF]HCD9234555.1 hypothetical protein [Elizabethkingia anophelis]